MKPPRWHFAIAAWLLCGWCAGCGSSSGSHERFIPAPKQAVATIESVLEAWRRGDPVGEIPNTKPRVFVVDSHRREGQTLEQFEILGEVAGLTQRTFLVKVTLEIGRAHV